MSIEKYTWDGQDAKVVEKIHAKILDMLTSGESINYIALQKKPAVTLFPDSITLSNKRIFLCEFAKLGLATNFEIFSWHDIKDISFKEEIFGSKVTVIPFTGENLTVDYIPKVQARKLYQLIKEALDNMQDAKSSPKEKETPLSPPLHVPHPATPPAPKAITFDDEESKLPGHFAPAMDRPAPAAIDPPVIPTRPAPKEEEDDETTKKLTRLKNLFDRQLISQGEYETKKAEILRDL
ncbi:PH domain-containing protein [Sphingobacterium sp. lm-10]|uniref:PH domain-containing protein n=1 Tax=Sphingobacterium sp. lm-10 TaxID=2944904 RepID=UPI0020211DDC|nr:PH domain-containing protein [Sphingobacterium sp. lm-10]MCL7989290.1 PH domain-containing protein [Sphingobacterium sp. lm-10]